MIHVSNTLCHHFHYMSRKFGSLLNKRIEFLNIDGKEMAFGTSHNGCTPWRKIN